MTPEQEAAVARAREACLAVYQAERTLRAALAARDEVLRAEHAHWRALHYPRAAREIGTDPDGAHLIGPSNLRGITRDLAARERAAIA